MQPTMGPVLFNTRDIEAIVSGLQVTSTNIMLPAKKTMSQAVLAYVNRNKVVQGFFTDRKIIITCVIKQNTRVLLENALDTLWPIISGTEGTLVFSEGGRQRAYTATWSDFNLKRSSGGFAEFDLVFTCSDTYGYDPTYTLLLDQSGLVNQPQTLTMADIGGSAEWQAPIFELFISALTGGSAASLTLGNPATSQTITITRTWTAGDYVEIDSQNRTVKVNGNLVAFTGAFPEYNPLPLTTTGQAKVTITDTLTTRTIRLRARYYKRWA